MSIADEYGSTGGGTGTPEATATDAHKTMQDVKALATEKVGMLRDQATEKAGQLKDQASAMYDQGKEQAQQYYDQGKAALGQYEESLESYIREKPLQSVLIAAGVGAVLGILMKR
ncbi:MAG: hypothetical protein JWO31_3454 [Phycisphaerales bacterium]|nr:hypothetical protein [Phycisphaerales bacterium]